MVILPEAEGLLDLDRDPSLTVAHELSMFRSWGEGNGWAIGCDQGRHRFGIALLVRMPPGVS